MTDSSFARFRFSRIGIVCVGTQCLARIGRCPANETTGGRARATTGRATPSPGGVGHDVKASVSSPADQARRIRPSDPPSRPSRRLAAASSARAPTPSGQAAAAHSGRSPTPRFLRSWRRIANDRAARPQGQPCGGGGTSSTCAGGGGPGTTMGAGVVVVVCTMTCGGGGGGEAQAVNASSVGRAASDRRMRDIWSSYAVDCVGLRGLSSASGRSPRRSCRRFA